MKPYRLIDPAVLLEAAGGDANLFRALSQTYLDIAPSMAGRLLAALERADLDEIVHASHALKGTAGLVGAVELCGLLQAIESAARRGRCETATLEDGTLAGLCRGVLAEVASSLAAGPAPA